LIFVFVFFLVLPPCTVPAYRVCMTTGKRPNRHAASSFSLVLSVLARTRARYIILSFAFCYFFVFWKRQEKDESEKKKKSPHTSFPIRFLRLARAPSHTCNGHSALRARTDPNIASS
jgi:hypothetical protein